MSVTDGHLWLKLTKSFSTCFTPVFLAPAVVTLESLQTHHTGLSSQSEHHHLVSRRPWCMKWADVVPSSGPDSLSHLNNTGQPPSAKGSREGFVLFQNLSAGGAQEGNSPRLLPLPLPHRKQEWDMLLTKVNWKEEDWGHPVMQTVPQALALWDPS